MLLLKTLAIKITISARNYQPLSLTEMNSDYHKQLVNQCENSMATRQLDSLSTRTVRPETHTPSLGEV